jgi:hypothetical protein
MELVPNHVISVRFSMSYFFLNFSKTLSPYAFPSLSIVFVTVGFQIKVMNNSVTLMPSTCTASCSHFSYITFMLCFEE